MRKHVIAIYDETKQDYVSAIPYVYNGTQWVPINPKIYTDSWKDIGGVGELFYKYLTKDTANNEEGEWYNEVLIRHKDYDTLVDKQGRPVCVRDMFAYPGNPVDLHIVFEHTIE